MKKKMLLIVLAMIVMYSQQVEACRGYRSEVRTVYRPKIMTTQEYEELAKLVMAEAESESLYGKQCVVYCILNRKSDSRFPNTVHDVIYERGQFSPITDGRFDSAQPTRQCYEAIDNVLKEGIQSDCLYFCRYDCSGWHDSALTFLFIEGNHNFYK